MHAQLARLAAEFDHAAMRLETLADALPSERWSMRNDPERWSVAECVAHLNLTSEAYVPRLWKALAEARQMPPIKGRKYRRDLKGGLLSSMIGPLPTIRNFRIGRVKTTPAFVPTGNEPQNVLLAEFKRYQLEFKRMLEEGDGLQLDRVSIVAPFGEKLRYSSYSAFTILPRHQERHLDQAERVWR